MIRKIYLLLQYNIFKLQKAFLIVDETTLENLSVDKMTVSKMSLDKKDN
jgi:hypothetical protein